MLKIGRLSCFAFFLFCVSPVPVFGEVHFTVENETPVFDGTPTVHVDISASTWKPRGRLLYDIEGAVRVKLASAGFEVVRTQSSSHDFVLYVDYQETRGAPIGVNDFGTVMTGTFRLKDLNDRTLFELIIQETADPSNLGTPPYLDALQNFQTNPYYYFLGSITWEQLHGQPNVQSIFLKALYTLAHNPEKINESDPIPSHAHDSAHSMVPPQLFFAARAIQRTLHEFVKSEDQEIVPILLLLLDYPHANVRVSAINTLGSFRVVESKPILEELRQKDLDIGVRNAAQAVLEAFETS